MIVMRPSPTCHQPSPETLFLAFFFDDTEKRCGDEDHATEALPPEYAKRLLAYLSATLAEAGLPCDGDAHQTIQEAAPS